MTRPLHRLLPLAAFAAVVAAAGAPGAAGVPPPAAPSSHDLGPTTGWLVSDGVRYVAWELPGDPPRTRVFDARRRRTFDVPTPRGCAHGRPSYTVGLAAVGGGRLLWTCLLLPDDPNHIQNNRRDARVLNLRTGTVFRPAGIEQARRLDDYVGFHAIGRRWIRGWASRGNTNGSSGFHLDLVTGEMASRGPGPGEVADLDRRRLAKPICRPLRREPNPDARHQDDADPFLPFQYSRPYAISGNGRLTLRRCGRRGGRRLPGRNPFWAQIGGGVVTWEDIETDTLFAYVLRTRRLHRIRDPRAGVVVHAGRTVVWTRHPRRAGRSQRVVSRTVRR